MISLLEIECDFMERKSVGGGKEMTARKSETERNEISTERILPLSQSNTEIEICQTNYIT